MSKQKGFTLIELVVVIVILGILAVTAAPKFLNLQNDARNASLQGLKGAIQGAASIVYGKAAIDGVESADADAGKKVEGIDVVYGYPKATSAALGLAVNGLSEDWSCKNITDSTPLSVQCTFKGKTAFFESGDSCYVQYEQATSSAAAITKVIASGASCK
ncbi:type II secretion system protein [Photobacterium leiognathi]|uniref:type II secretion system protein n=1 Tax=Photobacterium leiognathi TaxID=553611 RepID=UPI0027344401|nr:type II secretion system protein [Photobacterium leiognathi]